MIRKAPHLLSLIALVTVSCAFTSYEDPLATGRGDATGIIDRGELGYGDEGAVTGTFSRSRDLESHRYTFEAAYGVDLTIEVTQRGSSRGLDTLLFLYVDGDMTLSSGGRLAMDDDSGYGALSKISSWAPGTGTYDVIVSRREGSHGDYRLRLLCGSEVCAPEKTRLQLKRRAVSAALDEHVNLADPSGIWRTIYAFGHNADAPTLQSAENAVKDFFDDNGDAAATRWQASVPAQRWQLQYKMESWNTDWLPPTSFARFEELIGSEAYSMSMITSLRQCEDVLGPVTCADTIFTLLLDDRVYAVVFGVQLSY